MIEVKELERLRKSPHFADIFKEMKLKVDEKDFNAFFEIDEIGSYTDYLLYLFERKNITKVRKKDLEVYYTLLMLISYLAERLAWREMENNLLKFALKSIGEKVEKEEDLRGYA